MVYIYIPLGGKARQIIGAAYTPGKKVFMELTVILIKLIIIIIIKKVISL